MNWPKPLLPSQDRDEQREYVAYNFSPQPIKNKFATIFIWVCILTGFALIGAAFAFYS